MRPFHRTLVIAVVVALSAAVYAQAVNVTGKWSFEVQTGQGSGTPTITFAQEGEKLTGTYAGQFGTSELTGTVKGNDIHFSFNADVQGTTIDMVYDGTIATDTMKGGVTMAGGQLTGTFTGKKQ